MAWPIISVTSSGVSILALVWKAALNLALSTFASPAVTIRMASPSTLNDRDLAMRAGMTPAASAASSTVALETGNSKTLLSSPNWAR